MNDKDAISSFLEHHDVKGMRWGVRRSQSQLDRAAGRKAEKKEAKEKKRAERQTRTNTSTRKGTDSLSDSELKAVVNRMNLEKQYASLQPTSFSQKSTKFMGEIAVGVAKTQLTQLGNNQAQKLIGQFMANRSGIPTPPKTLRPLNTDVFRNAPNPRDRVG